MTKYTAEEVEKIAAARLYVSGDTEIHGMLRELARRLRLEEQEALRDPVKDPRPGDRVEIGKNTCVFGTSKMMDYNAYHKDDFKSWAEHEGATIIRRREVGT